MLLLLLIHINALSRNPANIVVQMLPQGQHRPLANIWNICVHGHRAIASNVQTSLMQLLYTAGGNKLTISYKRLILRVQEHVLRVQEQDLWWKTNALLEFLTHCFTNGAIYKSCKLRPVPDLKEKIVNKSRNAERKINNWFYVPLSLLDFCV